MSGNSLTVLVSYPDKNESISAKFLLRQPTDQDLYKLIIPQSQRRSPKGLAGIRLYAKPPTQVFAGKPDPRSPEQRSEVGLERSRITCGMTGWRVG